MSTGTPVPTNPAIAEDAGTLTPGLASQFRRRLNEYVGSVEDKVQVVQAYVEHHIDVHGYGALAGGTIAPGTGLSVTISPYEAVVGNYVYYDGTVTLGDLAANNTNYIYLHQDGTFEANVAGTVPAPSVHGPAVYWGYAQTDAGSVVAVSNLRPAAWRQSVGTITLSGGTITPVAEEIACSHLTLAGTPSGTVLLRMPVQYGREWHVENATSEVVQLAGTVGGTALIGPGGASCVYCGADGYKRYTGTDGYIVVAASDAPSFLKQTAHFVCDGTADEVEINQALANGAVQLTQGTYYLDGPIVMPSGSVLRGVGGKTVIYVATGKRFNAVECTTDDADSGTATGGSTTTLTDSTKSWATDAFAYRLCHIIGGDGAGQVAVIASNTATTLTFTTALSVAVGAGSVYRIEGPAGSGFEISDLAIAHTATVYAYNTITSATAVSITRTGAGWATDEHAGKLVYICTGSGRGQAREVLSNTSDTLTLRQPLDTVPASRDIMLIGPAGIVVRGAPPRTVVLQNVIVTTGVGGFPAVLAAGLTLRVNGSHFKCFYAPALYVGSGHGRDITLDAIEPGSELRITDTIVGVTRQGLAVARGASPALISGCSLFIVNEHADGVLIRGGCGHRVTGCSCAGVNTSSTETSGTATGGSGTTLVKSGAGWSAGAYAHYALEITGGACAGDRRLIQTNTSDTITVYQAFSGTPDSTSVFRVKRVGVSLVRVLGGKGIIVRDNAVNGVYESMLLTVFNEGGSAILCNGNVAYANDEDGFIHVLDTVGSEVTESNNYIVTF